MLPPDPPAGQEDDELMIRLQSGEHAAFEALVDKYRGPLEGFFMRNLKDRQLAEDLTQETLLKIYDRNWDYLPLGRFRGWMYRIARNLMIDKVRRQTNDVIIQARKTRPADRELDPLNWIAGERLPPEEAASHHEVAGMVDDLLRELPEEQRLTFTLHHYSGLTLPEVAEIMETSVPTTKSRLRLAREKLSAQLSSLGVQLQVVANEEESTN